MAQFLKKALMSEVCAYCAGKMYKVLNCSVLEIDDREGIYLCLDNLCFGDCRGTDQELQKRVILPWAGPNFAELMNSFADGRITSRDLYGYSTQYMNAHGGQVTYGSRSG